MRKQKSKGEKIKKFEKYFFKKQEKIDIEKKKIKNFFQKNVVAKSRKTPYIVEKKKIKKFLKKIKKKA